MRRTERWPPDERRRRAARRRPRPRPSPRAPPRRRDPGGGPGSSARGASCPHPAARRAAARARRRARSRAPRRASSLAAHLDEVGTAGASVRGRAGGRSRPRPPPSRSRVAAAGVAAGARVPHGSSAASPRRHAGSASIPPPAAPRPTAVRRDDDPPHAPSGQRGDHRQDARARGGPRRRATSSPISASGRRRPHLLRAEEDAHRDREVQRGARLAQLRRGKVDGDPARRVAKPAFRSAPRTRSRASDSAASGRPDDREPGQIRARRRPRPGRPGRRGRGAWRRAASRARDHASGRRSPPAATGAYPRLTRRDRGGPQCRPRLSPGDRRQLRDRRPDALSTARAKSSSERAEHASRPW